jgi:FkbM family methyltransferase
MRRVRQFLDWEHYLVRGMDSGSSIQQSAYLGGEVHNGYDFADLARIHWRLIPTLPLVVFPQNRWTRAGGRRALEVARNKYRIVYSEDTPPEFLQETYVRQIYTRFPEFVAGPGDVVLDVGAQFGDFALLCAKGLGAKRVVAFEPHPENFRILQKNLALNGEVRVEAEKVLVSDRNDADTTISGSRTVQTSGAGPRLQVQSRTLDSYGFSQVSLLKIDVEGYELQVLEGARDLLQRLHPRVILETHSLRLDRAVDDFLRERGYDRRHSINLLVFTVPGLDCCKSVYYA